ncbi:MAG TPA: patatin-like phospholipase family protein [Acidobacteriaceae bacterium]|nr:patatin-like phospholipase family protein [Acidobacteriaceae bacterium]
MGKYRILSLDGGGSWALIQVKALIDIYGAQINGHDLLKQFDLVAANSGGSIVLGCLIENFTLQKTFDFFNTESLRKAVFSPTKSIVDRALHQVLGFGPKYDADSKLAALQHVLTTTGNIALPDAVKNLPAHNGSDPVHVLIVAFDYDHNRASFFRSRAVSRATWGTGEIADVTVAEAIHASTNAPVNYFDGPATFPDRSDRYWDGAISGCNNPVLTAVTEAVGTGQAPDNNVVLSLGTASVALPWQQTGKPPSPYTQRVSPGGLKNDLLKLATSILDDPPDVATFIAHVMTDSGRGLNVPTADSRIVRMSPLISPMLKNGSWEPPDSMAAAQFQYLANLDMDAVEQPQVDAIAKYADLWLQDQAMNQPIRMDSTTLTAELGHDRYSKAKAAWRGIQ